MAFYEVALVNRAAPLHEDREIAVLHPASGGYCDRLVVFMEGKNGGTMPKKRRGKKDPSPEQPGEGEAPQETQPEGVGAQATCPHQSADLSQCCALGRPVADAGAALDSIRRDAERLDGAIRFDGELATPGLTDKLVVKFTIPFGPGVALHGRLFPYREQTVDVIVLVREQAPAKGELLPGQTNLFDQRPAVPEPIEMLVCASCQRIIRLEGQEPGSICGFCLDGELRITSVVALVCSNCQQPQELATAQVGDTCTLCKEGRYLYVGQEAAPAPGGDPDVLYITPDRVAEFSDAISAMRIAEERVVKALVQIGEQQFAVLEAASADPVTFSCWRAVPLADWGDGGYHEYPGDNGDDYDGLKVTLRDSGGAPFVLQGPPMRVVAKAASETEETPEADA